MKKRFISTALSTIAIVSFACSGSKAYRSADPQKETAIAEAVSVPDYTITVNRALPQNGRSVSLTTNYELTVRNDSVYSYLPYFGRAYSVPYGGGEGLRFETSISGYTVTESTNNSKQVDFTARTSEDTYTFSLEIFPNGTSYINVRSNNKQGIGYSGKLDPFRKRD